jgi:DNA-binding transcriptional MerR regulator
MSAPLLLTEKQAAAYVGVCSRTLAKWRREGIVAPVDIGTETNRVYYRSRDLDEFVAGLEATP